ncbi:MAG TPA: hypothetical protein VN437_00700, partial [Rectinemataceae bacterium]|nr:hypothetical protein [Rectinemataceae bacterium]
MDLSRFSIDTALFSGADADNAYRSIFFDRLLSGLFENDENLFVKTDIQKDREKIFVFPALYWLTRASKPQEKSKVLYLSFDEETAAAACESAAEMSASFRDKAKPVLLSAENAGSEDVKNADLLFAAVQTFFDLLPSDAIAPRQFGFVIADQAEKTAELPGEVLRKLQGFLLPSWERKTLVIAGKHTPRAKNFAWDFADNPKELKLGETMGYAGTMATISRDIVEADKIRFILHLLADGEVHHLCVFCNLKSAAEELSARLTMNGVAADYIGGNLNPDRKNQIVTKALTWNGVRGPAATGESSPVMEEGAETGETVVEPPKPAAPVSRSRFAADSFVLVLTDEGSKGIDRSEFSIVINHDIPLEPEFYFERLNFLKRQDPQARLYNLVCERYMYGLPAIERLTDASLEVRPLEADIELPEDLSAGKEIPMPETRFRGRDDRHGRGRDSYGEGRSEGRGGMRAPEGDRDHDYRRESPYDQRRPESPDRDRGSDRPSAQAGRDAGRDAGREAAGREAGRDAGRSQAMREGGRPGGREAGRPQAGRREGARRMDSDRRESGATADP